MLLDIILESDILSIEGIYSIRKHMEDDYIEYIDKLVEEVSEVFSLSKTEDF